MREASPADKAIGYTQDHLGSYGLRKLGSLSPSAHLPALNNSSKLRGG